MDLEKLIAEFVERREAGETLAPESFAGEYPHAGSELIDRLAALVSTESLFAAGSAATPTFGSYRVLEELGRGGMGVVYRAEHTATGEAAALKVLHRVAKSDARLARRFAREGTALRGVDHPSIVRVRDVGTEGDLPWIAMELVEGRSLAADVREASACADAGVLAESPAQRWRGAFTLCARLAGAVHAAHRAGVLHRDIKPGNVIVRPSGEPVLLDFGLVRHEDSPTVTRTGDLIGTPQYMAPEQARGEATDARSDVYSLGVVLFELVTLRTPHRGDDPMAVLESVWTEPAPKLEDVAPKAPAEVAAVVDRALAFESRRRYASAAALAEDLERVLAGRRPRDGGRWGRLLGR